MTALRTFKFEPVAGKRYALELPGAALFVRQGGWPGLRIFIDEASEGFEGQHSAPLDDGSMIVRPFKRAYIQFPTIVGTIPLIVEHMDCATLATDPSAGMPPVLRKRYFARSTEAEHATTGEHTLFTFEPALEERGGFDDRYFYSPDAYLGGVVAANQTYTLRLYHDIYVGSVLVGSVKAATWVPVGTGAPDPFKVILDHGGYTRSWAAGTAQMPCPLPAPGWHITIDNAGALNDFHVLLYSRSAG